MDVAGDVPPAAETGPDWPVFGVSFASETPVPAALPVGAICIPIGESIPNLAELAQIKCSYCLVSAGWEDSSKNSRCSNKLLWSALIARIAFATEDGPSLPVKLPQFHGGGCAIAGIMVGKFGVPPNSCIEAGWQVQAV